MACSTTTRRENQQMQQRTPAIRRTLDALHLATALEVEAATLVSFDPRLRDAARSQGIFAPGPHAGHRERETLE